MSTPSKPIYNETLREIGGSVKRAGIYMTKQYGVIWLVEKVEYYEKSITTDGEEFSILVSGFVDGKQAINRCLFRGSQFKNFVRIGDL